MPDEETPRPRELAARDEAEGTPLDVAPGDIAPDSGEPPAWASPAADVTPPLREDAGRATLPTVGGWLGRLRAVVWGDRVAPPPPPTPRYEPGPGDEPLLPPTPRFEAPPRPALLADDEPSEAHAPTAPAAGGAPVAPTEPVVEEAAPAAAPADASPTTLDAPDRAAAPFATDPAPAEFAAPPAVEVEPAAAEVVATDTPAVPPAESTQAAPPVAEPEPPTDAAPDALAEPEPAAPEAEPEVLQPVLFDGATAIQPSDAPAEPPAVPEEERELVASAQVAPEVVEHAIEHALHEAEAALEHAPDAPPAADETPAVPPLTLIAEALPLPDPDAESPEEEQAVREEAALIARGGLFSRFAWPSHPHYWNGFLTLITGLVTLSFLMFVLVEPSPRWILLVVALGVAAGMDGVLRATWRASFARGEDTTPYLFLPALYVFAAPLIIEHNVSGHAVLAWGLFAGVGFGAIAVAEVLSVRTGSRLYPYARMVTTGAAYFTAFAILALTYVLDLHILPAFFATWLVGWMLAVEVLREGEVDPVETVVFAGLVGLLVAQVRWLLYYLPLDGYLAGLALVLVFYFVSGVLHSYVVRQLNAITAAEYALVTVIGMVLVGAARVAGLA
ncbi:MAG: hypothetical protein AB7G21_10170 [Dehalococcoidia bacterium]